MVPIGGREGEGVGEMADGALGLAFEQDLDDIEPELDGGVFETADVVQRGQRQKASLARVHGCGRSGPGLGGPRFDLDEYEAVPVAADDVDLALGSAVVGSQEFETGIAEKAAGGQFAADAPGQMGRHGFAAQQLPDAGPPLGGTGEVHWRRGGRSN